MDIRHQLFFTATIYEWHPILEDEECKDIIIESLRYLVEKNRICLYSFVIMPNHIHLIWKILEGQKTEDVQRDFLKYTGQQIKFYLQKKNPKLLEKLKVDLKDRTYQIWQRNALSVPLWTPSVIVQKLNYIHNNPVQKKWQLSEVPEKYKYSSASYYINNETKYDFLTHYLD